MYFLSIGTEIILVSSNLTEFLDADILVPSNANNTGAGAARVRAL